MVDSEVARIARDRVQIEVGEQSAQILQEVARIKAEAAARGMFGGGTAACVADLYADAIKTRALIAWQTYFRFFTTTGITYSDSLSADLKALVEEHLPEQLNDMKDDLKQLVVFIGLPQLFEHLAPRLDSARSIALEKVGTEIDLFVHSLKRRQEMKANSDSSTVFNIYSPVGSIQTGNNSISHVNQSIDAEVKDKLIDALNCIADQLGHTEALLPVSKQEVKELIDDSQREVEKNAPNMTKLRSLLTAVGTSIQTVASMAPAYELLKQALVFVGVSLP